MTATDKAVELLRLHTGAGLLGAGQRLGRGLRPRRRPTRLPGPRHREYSDRRLRRLPRRIADPLALVLDMTARIVAATDLPVSADLEAGYGDVAATIARGHRCRGGRREPRRPDGFPCPRQQRPRDPRRELRRARGRAPGAQRPNRRLLGTGPPRASPRRPSPMPSPAAGPSSTQVSAACSCPATLTPPRSASWSTPSATEGSASSAHRAVLRPTNLPPSALPGCLTGPIHSAWHSSPSPATPPFCCPVAACPTTRQANRPLPANASRRAGADRSPMSPHPYRGPLTDDSPLKSAPSGTSAPVVEKAVVG